MLHLFKRLSIHMKSLMHYFPTHWPSIFRSGLPEISLGKRKDAGLGGARKKGQVNCSTWPGYQQGRPPADFR